MSVDDLVGIQLFKITFMSFMSKVTDVADLSFAFSNFVVSIVKIHAAAVIVLCIWTIFVYLLQFRYELKCM